MTGWGIAAHECFARGLLAAPGGTACVKSLPFPRFHGRRRPVTEDHDENRVFLIWNLLICSLISCVLVWFPGLPGLIFGMCIASPWCRMARAAWLETCLVAVLSPVGYVTAVSIFAQQGVGPLAGLVGCAIMMAPVLAFGTLYRRLAALLACAVGGFVGVVLALAPDLVLMGGIGLWQLAVGATLIGSLPREGRNEIDLTHLGAENTRKENVAT